MADGGTLSVAREFALYHSSMRNMLLRGVPGASVLRYLQAGGIGYRKGDFYEDVRRISGYRGVVEKLKDANPLRRITSGMTIPREPGESQRMKYNYQIKHTLTDPSTGKQMTTYETVTSSYLRSPNWAQQQALGRGEAERWFSANWTDEVELEYVTTK